MCLHTVHTYVFVEYVHAYNTIHLQIFHHLLILEQYQEFVLHSLIFHGMHLIE